MNLRSFAACAAVLLVAGLVFHRAGSAAPPAKDAGTKDAPAKDAKQESLALQYARAQLRFAELTLKKAQDMNRKVSQTLAPAMVRQFSDDVEYAKLQLENATTSDEVDSFKVWLDRVELELRTAEAKLKRINEANRINANAYPPVDLERAKVGIEVARLRLERGRSLENAAPEVKLAWQVEMVSEGLNRLYEMTSLSIQNRLSEFFLVAGTSVNDAAAAA